MHRQRRAVGWRTGSSFCGDCAACLVVLTEPQTSARQEQAPPAMRSTSDTRDTCQHEHAQTHTHKHTHIQKEKEAAGLMQMAVHWVAVLLHTGQGHHTHM